MSSCVQLYILLRSLMWYQVKHSKRYSHIFMHPCIILFFFSIFIIITTKKHFIMYTPLSCNLSNKGDSVSSGYPNMEKRVENMTRSGVFLTKFKLLAIETLCQVFNISCQSKRKLNWIETRTILVGTTTVKRERWPPKGACPALNEHWECNKYHHFFCFIVLCNAAIMALTACIQYCMLQY